MASHSIDFKHADMKRACELVSERIKDAQRRRDNYKRMSGTQKVNLPDRFGNQVFEAKDMVWLYENELASLQKVYDELYSLFRIQVSGRPRRDASSSKEGPSPDLEPSSPESLDARPRSE